MAHRIPLIGDKSTVVIQMSERVSDRKKKKNRTLPDFDPIPLIEYLHKYVYSAKVPTVF